MQLVLVTLWLACMDSLDDVNVSLLLKGEGTTALEVNPTQNYFLNPSLCPVFQMLRATGLEPQCLP